MGDEVMRTIMERASVRRFTEQPVAHAVVERLVLAAQQAPFTGQMYSFVATMDQEQRQRAAAVLGGLVLRAPVFMLVCVDFRKLEKFIAFRGRRNLSDDLGMLFLGIQDASYAAQNLVLAAEAEGLGSCFLGAAPFRAAPLIEMFGLPERVYPLVGLVLGHPAEHPKPRPRIPLEHCLFWDRYLDLQEDDVARAMSVMDAGMIREGYYAKLGARIPLPSGDDQVGFDEYGWSEHMSRKYGEHGVSKTAGLQEYLEQQAINVRGEQPPESRGPER